MVLGENNAFRVLADGATFRTKSSVGSYNYLEAQLDMLLSGKNGNTGLVALKDKAGARIVELGYSYKDGVLDVFHPVSGQRLISVMAEAEKTVTLRLEYHYDMKSPTLFVYLRYIDAESGFVETEAAEMTGVPVTDAAASAKAYSMLYIVCKDGEAVVDEVLARAFAK